MRGYLLAYVFTLLGASLSTRAQTSAYHPFPESNIQWSQEDWHNDGGSGPCIVYDDYTMFISGDTTVGTYTYKKLYKDGYEYASCPPPGRYYNDSYCGTFRQDSANKKVYQLYNGIDTIVYDFNLTLGDTLRSTLIIPNNLTVQSIDSIKIGNNFRKRFWLKDPRGAPNQEFLIEGIGNIYGVFTRINPPIESGNELFCVSINNQSVYTDSIYGRCFVYTGVDEVKNTANVLIYPNPFAVHTTVAINLSTPACVQITLNNALGQQIYMIENGYLDSGPHTYDVSASEKGLYFIKSIIDGVPSTHKVVQIE